MSYVKAICCEIKNNKGMFLNWPVNNKIRLGEFGFVDTKHHVFDWVGNLGSYGVNLEAVSGLGEENEQYRTSGKVQARFDLSGDTPASVEISFSRASAISMEAYKMRVDRLEVESVKTSIFTAIAQGKLKWHRNYVFITQIHKCDSFTSLVSGCRGAAVKLTAKGAPHVRGFNTADPNIGLFASYDSGMSCSNVAKKEAYPFFICHKIKIEDNQIVFKRFGIDYDWIF